MEIIGKVETKGYLRVIDLQNGEVFVFLDDNRPLIKVFDGYANGYVDLEDGNFVYADSESNDDYDRPVRKIKAKLIIED